MTSGIFNTERRAIVVAEIEPGKIAVQVLLAAVLIGALPAPLEDVEIAFNRVGADRTIRHGNVFARTVYLLAALSFPRDLN